MYWNIKTLTQVESANDYLSKSIKNGLREGDGVVAQFQTAGKGQIGNHWESADSQNLLMSILLEPSFLPPMRQFLLSKTVSVALVLALKPYIEDIKIKWPNDIYIGNRKLAGILIENSIIGTMVSHAVVGIGLNVNQTDFFIAPNPVSLKLILNKTFNITTIRDILLEKIGEYYAMLKNGEFNIINNLYLKHLYRADGYFFYRDKNGIFEAKIKLVEDSGRLVLETPSGELKFFWFKEVEIVLEKQ